jgi:hypothetical protein
MKKTIFKRTMSFALALLLAIVVFPSTAKEASAADYTGCLIQHDPRWGSYTVNGGTLSGTACGVFSLINCVGYLTGKTMDIYEVAEWAHDVGAFNMTYGGDGTDRTVLYRKVQAKYGSTYGITVDCDSDGGGYWSGSYNTTLQNHLANGGVAVGHVPGHFIALVGFESGKYHVYESSPSDARGTNYNGGDVWLTPAQLASGRLYMDWFCLISSTTKDTKGPVISDISFSEVSASGYTITCKVTDDFYVERVSFPTWTTKNEQDDLPAQFLIKELGKRNGDYFTYRVNASAHNYETGEYKTHIYAIDRGGNRVCYEINSINVRNDKVNPVITDVKVSDISTAGYTVSCKVTDDWGVNRVSFPVWTQKNGQDDLAEQFLDTQLGTKNGDTYTFRVNASAHNNETGMYETHIYAIDCAGNRVCYEMEPIEVKNYDLEKITLSSSSSLELDGSELGKVEDSTTVQSLLSQFNNKSLEVVNKDAKKISGSELVGTGSVIKLYSGSVVVDAVTVVITGDIDGNGKITSADYLRVKGAFNSEFVLGDAEFKAADVDGSAKINATDYVRIKSHLSGGQNLYS